MATVPFIGRDAPPEAEATHALYERYAPQILRYCLSQLGSREEAEDAVQSTFLNAFRGLKRGVEPELEAAWLFKIAHNVCLSRRRSTWRRGRIESPADFEVVQEFAPAPSRRADELIGLQDVLEGMPEQQRRAILLREWQGLSYREIADELELSQAAVETLIFRARRSLAAGLEGAREPARRRRSAPAAAVANLLSAAQSWLFGGGAAAVKVAATVAVDGAGTVAATAPVRHHAPPATPAPAHHPAKPAPVRSVSSGDPAAVLPVRRPAAPVATAHVRRAPVRHAGAPGRTRTLPAAASSARQSHDLPAQAHAHPVQAGGPHGRAASGHGQAHQVHGRATAPGQLKKQERAAGPPVASPPVEAAQADPSSPPEQSSPSGGALGNGDGLGNGHGRGNGHGQGHGYGRDTLPGTSGE